MIDMKKLFAICMVLVFMNASAQNTHTVPVQVSDQTQVLNNKTYYIHIVQQGQTVFSISRAYGLKYYDAVIKTDIHQLKVGDTVWLPMTDNSVAAVRNAAQKVTDPAKRVHYIKVQPGETLYNLSRTYHVSVDNIIAANPSLQNESLKAGEMIIIPAPDGTVLPEAPAKEQPAANPQGEGSPAAPAKSAATDNREAAQQQSSTTEKQSSEPAASADQAQSPVTQEARPKTKTETPVNPPVTQKPAVPAVASAPERAAEPEISGTSDRVVMTPVSGEEAAPLARPVRNPYPFTEVPANFPTAQAPFLNSMAASSFPFQVRDRQSKEKVYVTVVMPLNLDKMGEISTSKFDIEQRGKKDYKVFEFIQFYEGILMALNELEAKGCNVVLNVVDLVSEQDADVEAAFESHQVANSDLIIALLVKKPFHKMAELAKQHQVFIVNPFSSRDEVVKDNPYVVKYMPSVEGVVKGMLDIVEQQHKGAHLFLLHSNNKSLMTDERIYFEEFQRQLTNRKNIQYTFFDWAANGKLVSSLKAHDQSVIISIYNRDKNKNTVFATTLLNRLSAQNSHVPVLLTNQNYLTEFSNVDYEQLQHLNYTTVTLGYLDYNNALHKNFIDTYKEQFRTEPNTLYAGVAHDVMLYFVSALSQQGAEFWRHPETFRTPSGMLFPLCLRQSSSTGGYENQCADFYRMVNFKLTPVLTY